MNFAERMEWHKRMGHKKISETKFEKSNSKLKNELIEKIDSLNDRSYFCKSTKTKRQIKAVAMSENLERYGFK